MTREQLIAACNLGVTSAMLDAVHGVSQQGSVATFNGAFEALIVVEGSEDAAWYALLCDQEQRGPLNPHAYRRKQEIAARLGC